MILKSEFKTIIEAHAYLKALYIEYFNSSLSVSEFAKKYEILKNGDIFDVSTEVMQALLRNGKDIYERAFATKEIYKGVYSNV